MKNTNGTDETTSQALLGTALSLLIFSSAALTILFTTLFVGGQPWAILCLSTLVVQAMTDRHLQTLAVIVPGLCWLILFRVTGNRELFFPYSMYLAAHVSILLCRRSILLGSIGGIVVVAAFLGLRILQQATWPVLAVELGVAAGILGLILVAYAASPKNIYTHAMIAGAASGLAYLGLSI